jgi:hypothetical protein
VRSLDQEPALEGLEDEQVLTLASEEGRILITHDVSDFPRILREWEAVGRSHAGVILVCGIDHRESQLIIRGVERLLELRPDASSWVDLAAGLDRSFASG